MDPFLGEIRIFTWDWAPAGWALCNGASVASTQNQALAALIGVTYGGVPQVSFNLPDLRGRTPVHMGLAIDQSYTLGMTGGVEAVALSTQQIPAHSHVINAVTNSAINKTGPSGNMPATVRATIYSPINIYSKADPATNIQLMSDTLIATGSGAPHNNMQPFVVVNYCIAIAGIYPPRQ